MMIFNTNALVYDLNQAFDYIKIILKMLLIRFFHQFR